MPVKTERVFVGENRGHLQDPELLSHGALRPASCTYRTLCWAVDQALDQAYSESYSLQQQHALQACSATRSSPLRSKSMEVTGKRILADFPVSSTCSAANCMESGQLACLSK